MLKEMMTVGHWDLAGLGVRILELDKERQRRCRHPYSEQQLCKTKQYVTRMSSIISAGCDCSFEDSQRGDCFKVRRSIVQQVSASKSSYKPVNAHLFHKVQVVPQVHYLRVRSNDTDVQDACQGA
jgi:hypothetical protein